MFLTLDLLNDGHADMIGSTMNLHSSVLHGANILCTMKQTKLNKDERI